MNWLLENWTNLLTALGSLYLFATTVALLTPSDKDNTFLEKLGAFFDRVGLNIKGKTPTGDSQ